MSLHTHTCSMYKHVHAYTHVLVDVQYMSLALNAHTCSMYMCMHVHEHALHACTVHVHNMPSYRMPCIRTCLDVP